MKTVKITNIAHGLNQFASHIGSGCTGGISLTGESGVGKTHLARLMENECMKMGIPFYRITGAFTLAGLRQLCNPNEYAVYFLTEPVQGLTAHELMEFGHLFVCDGFECPGFIKWELSEDLSFPPFEETSFGIHGAATELEASRAAVTRAEANLEHELNHMIKHHGQAPIWVYEDGEEVWGKGYFVPESAKGETVCVTLVESHERAEGKPTLEAHRVHYSSLATKGRE